MVTVRLDLLKTLNICDLQKTSLNKATGKKKSKWKTGKRVNIQFGMLY